MTDKKRDRIYLGILAALTIAVFSKAFVSQYVNWDDNVLITDNALLHIPFFEALKLFFTHFYFSDYMPVTMLTFWADVQLFGVNPPLQHSISLFIHIANVILMYKFLQRVLGRGVLTDMVTAVFAIHPVQVEIVMWTTSRNGLLSTTFTLLSLLAWEKSFAAKGGDYRRDYRRDYRWITGSWFLYVVAVLCKSVALLTPLLFVILAINRHKMPWRKALFENMPLFVFAVVFIVIRLYAYTIGIKDFQEATFDFERLFYLPLMILNALALYMELIFWPARLSAIYPTFTPDATAVGYAVGFLVFAYLIVRMWRPDRRKELIFFLVVIFAYLLPVIQILPRTNYYNDRYLYFPLVGILGIIFEPVIAKIPKSVLFAVVGVLAVTSWQRSHVWVNDLALWADTTAKIPSNSLAHNNLGVAYQLRHDLGDAIEEYKKTIALDPTGAQGTAVLAYNNLGVILSEKKSGSYYNPEQALKFLGAGIKIAPRLHDTFDMRYNTGLIYAQTGRPQKAVETFEGLARDVRDFLATDQRYAGLLAQTENFIDQIKTGKFKPD